jgi:hypothetical protein
VKPNATYQRQSRRHKPPRLSQPAGDANVRNIPAPELDPTPPQEKLAGVLDPTLQEEPVVDPEILIDPPPDAPPEEIRKLPTNG